jgi:hypothetical protein
VSEHPTPHDALFKAVFSEPESALALVRSALAPELAAAIDPASLRPCPASFVDAELRQVHRDLLFTAKLAGEDVLVYLLLEHQSTVDPLMPLRLLRYVMRVWEAWLRENPRAQRLPAVLPIVLFQGPKPWTGPVRLTELVGLSPELLTLARRHLPELELTVQDLGHAPVLPPLAQTPTVALLTLLLMRGAAGRADLVAIFKSHASLARELLGDPRSRGHFNLLVRYTEAMTKNDRETVAERILDAISLDPDHPGRSAAEYLINESDRLVMQSVFTRLLRRRFGELDEATLARLESASMKDLERWIVRFVDAKKLGDVFRAPRSPKARRPRRKSS